MYFITNNTCKFMYPMVLWLQAEKNTHTHTSTENIYRVQLEKKTEQPAYKI